MTYLRKFTKLVRQFRHEKKETDALLLICIDNENGNIQLATEGNVGAIPAALFSVLNDGKTPAEEKKEITDALNWVLGISHSILRSNGKLKLDFIRQLTEPIPTPEQEQQSQTNE